MYRIAQRISADWILSVPLVHAMIILNGRQNTDNIIIKNRKYQVVRHASFQVSIIVFILPHRMSSFMVCALVCAFKIFLAVLFLLIQKELIRKRCGQYQFMFKYVHYVMHAMVRLGPPVEHEISIPNPDKV